MRIILIYFCFLISSSYTIEILLPNLHPMTDDIYKISLKNHKKYHGKLRMEAIAHIDSRDDLSWAYSPGVAEPCREIAKDPAKMYDYTLKSRTIAVISDGSAILGLGNLGHKASMPVMEGKCVLFKEFA